jgi:hypothetical protein
MLASVIDGPGSVLRFKLTKIVTPSAERSHDGCWHQCPYWDLRQPK